MSQITTLEELEALYGAPQAASVEKGVAALTPSYAAFIRRAPFVAVATVGPDGADCTPRGDPQSCVEIVDERTLLLPDRRGNNRCDTLRNLIHDSRIALMFMVPGSLSIVRVNGRARILTDAALIARLARAGKAPRSVIEIAIETVYFQCARAVMRARLWEPESFADPADLPSPGAFLADATQGKIDGRDYDARWAARAEETMW